MAKWLFLSTALGTVVAHDFLFAPRLAVHDPSVLVDRLFVGDGRVVDGVDLDVFKTVACVDVSKIRVIMDIQVIVYIFGEESDVSLYGFDSEIPVGIYQGECRIDFRRIMRDLKRLHL